MAEPSTEVSLPKEAHLKTPENQTEGGVPLLEVARLIETHGSALASALFTQQQSHFTQEETYDKEHGILLGDRGDDTRLIKVWIMPEKEYKKNENPPYQYPAVGFDYKNIDGLWKYDAAVIFFHGGYIEVGYRHTGSPTTRRDLWNTRVKMEDLERVLGRYLHPTLPQPDQDK